MLQHMHYERQQIEPSPPFEKSYVSQLLPPTLANNSQVQVHTVSEHTKMLLSSDLPMPPGGLNTPNIQKGKKFSSF